ncbi:MAG: bifunctional oligoribonuclease/PAP phosphatase NrnA [Spirochaetia bacterium]|nr:bifunctional oligoribonuclease/PAP phosphatase NrnA [Spirochaetia bacterium]
MNNRKLAKSLLQKYRPSSSILPKIKTFIEKNKRFILTTHIGADPDGLSSEVALYYLLKKLKKEVIILNCEKPPELLTFIDFENKINFIKDHYKDYNRWRAKLNDYALIVLDCSELKRLDCISNLIRDLNINWISIDHHLTPVKKNLFIDTSYPATTEIIWDLFHYMKIPLNKNIANILYAGLIADSGNFRYNKTSFRTHLAAGELLEFGIDSDLMYKKIFEAHPPDRLVLLKRLLKKMTLNKEFGYVFAEYKKNAGKNLDLGDSATDGIVNTLLAVRDIKIAALITETIEGELKCSLRSIGDVNVAKIAENFGGGGHKNAAGCRIQEPYKKAKKKIVAGIENYLKGVEAEQK